MERLTLLGVTVDPLTIVELHALISEAVVKDERWIIANHNLHSIYLYYQDPKMQALYAQAKRVHVDGMPLVYWGRLLGYPLQRAHRVTYVDWVRPLIAEAEHSGWNLFYLGGKPGVAARASEILQDEFPEVNIQSHHGYFDPNGAENERVLERIAAFSPQVLMVGMGMPRQEHWILDNLERIAANAILCAGACFDYVAGTIPTPPRWMGRVGLEWLHRLSSEPHRLAKRYLLEPWFLLSLAMGDVVGHLREKRQNGYY